MKSKKNEISCKVEVKFSDIGIELMAGSGIGGDPKSPQKARLKFISQ